MYIYIYIYIYIYVYIYIYILYHNFHFDYQGITLSNIKDYLLQVTDFLQ